LDRLLRVGLVVILDQFDQCLATGKLQTACIIGLLHPKPHGGPMGDSRTTGQRA